MSKTIASEGLGDGEEMQRLTVEELLAEVRQAEADIEAGKGIPWEEVRHRLADKLVEVKET